MNQLISGVSPPQIRKFSEERRKCLLVRDGNHKTERKSFSTSKSVNYNTLRSRIAFVGTSRQDENRSKLVNPQQQRSRASQPAFLSDQRFLFKFDLNEDAYVTECSFLSRRLPGMRGEKSAVVCALKLGFDDCVRCDFRVRCENQRNDPLGFMGL